MRTEIDRDKGELMLLPQDVITECSEKKPREKRDADSEESIAAAAAVPQLLAQNYLSVLLVELSQLNFNQKVRFTESKRSIRSAGDDDDGG